MNLSADCLYEIDINVINTVLQKETNNNKKPSLLIGCFYNIINNTVLQEDVQIGISQT
jgi:hypothetical protein